MRVRRHRVRSCEDGERGRPPGHQEGAQSAGQIHRPARCHCQRNPRREAEKSARRARRAFRRSWRAGLPPLLGLCSDIERAPEVPPGGPPILQGASGLRHPRRASRGRKRCGAEGGRRSHAERRFESSGRARRAGARRPLEKWKVDAARTRTRLGQTAEGGEAVAVLPCERHPSCRAQRGAKRAARCRRDRPGGAVNARRAADQTQGGI